MATTRPDCVKQLLDRNLPKLAIPRLTDSQNPPFSTNLRAQVADLKCHPLLESCLHLMNDDLFSAHFLLRKMQEDEWGKWLHACLHAHEGDFDKNAKLWYEQVDESILKEYWGDEKPAAKAIASGRDAIRVRDQGVKADVQEDEKLRKVRWQELVCIFEKLESKFGWDEWDGTKAYTKDESEDHKSNVLGEGWREF